ncbi:hypothetical protein COY28_04850 [Candidatus Woesearchaeota archaeon CG_4_10_14_0_2_um_filter_57_5]|nr:MAG: hypothetical protein AUJ68_06120 [Candidatus Woesearchaeota archaeon CG1_02_57_44]PIN69145.1 MAG: hypothetical protein COV94_03260 [Candidatus Woesearchaeota archaeon CG11_big_fil_rev_8_21_14_0_20_57_5]PIZ51714.1 MAG: hypothetical protein COY28_04850 [Candidatus Woesearchaeota archaeon CG_4_10_14_0_2_um_filter_57_5]
MNPVRKMREPEGTPYCFTSPGSGTTLSSSIVGDSDKVIFIAHGYLADKERGLYQMLARHLAQKGLGTFLMDFAGHGQSHGSPENSNLSTMLDDITAGQHFLRTRRRTIVGFFGESIGATAALLFASTVNLRCPLVLLAAPADKDAVWDEKTVTRWKESGLAMPQGKNKVIVPYSFYEDFSSHDIERAAKHYQGPVLVLQGDKDTTVPLHQSERLSQLFLDGSFGLIPGANHYALLPDQRRLVVSQAIDFFLAHPMDPHA